MKVDCFGPKAIYEGNRAFLVVFFDYRVFIVGHKILPGRGLNLRPENNGVTFGLVSALNNLIRLIALI